MKAKSPQFQSALSLLGQSLSLMSLTLIGLSTSARAQTWTNTTGGTSNWSDGINWSTSPTPPVSSLTTAITFFATPGTPIPEAEAIVAIQDIAAPMILNSLTVNGTGPASGPAPNLTLSGGALRFSGTTPSLNINAAYGGPGYTVNLNNNLDFSADTSINFSNAGATINVGNTVSLTGAGAVTFTGSLLNRPLSLTAPGTLSGDIKLNGGSSVLQLNKNNNILGPNTATTQSLTVASGSGVNLAYGNAAYTHPQNFVVNGNGNAATANAVINATQINFGNPAIGGLALAADATVRTTLNTADQNRGLIITRGIAGTGNLIKTGNGYLFPSVASPASVTWGGNTFSAYTGNVEIREGAIQTPSVSNALGPNTATTQRVTVSPGAAMIIGAGTNAWTQPQNMILNGSGTGYPQNNGGTAALDSFGTAFGSNTVRRIVLATDASVAVKRDAGGSGTTRGLTTLSGLSGTGNLTVGAPYGSATGPLYLNQPASSIEEFPGFTGKLVINNGIVNIGNASALGASPAGQITLSDLGAVSSSLPGGLDQDFLSRISNLSTTGGAVSLGSNSANPLDFSAAPHLRLGAITSSTYSGTLTPAGNVYRLGGGGGILTMSSPLIAGNSVVISGNVILANAANTFAGGITIAGNNTGVGQTAVLTVAGGTGASLNSNAISFSGAGGGLAYNGSATGSSDSLGALAFSAGHSTITSTKGAAGNTALTFSSMAPRSAGATGNFIVSGGTNGNDNKITVTGLAPGFVNKGIFFGGANFAFNDATGFVRAPVYGADAGFTTSSGGASIPGATHQQVTGALTDQNSATFDTLKLAGPLGVTLAGGQSLTVDGILTTGGAATISGGDGIRARADSEMVIRTDLAADNLTISTPILANGAGSLTKTGGGTLTLTEASTYPGVTTVVLGTLTVSGNGGLLDTAPVLVNGGTFNVGTIDIVGPVTLRNGAITGAATLIGESFALESGTVSAPLGGSATLTKTTAGLVTLSASCTHVGDTILQGGVLALVSATSGNLFELSPNLIVGDTAAHRAAVLDVTGLRTGFALSAGQFLTGHGTVHGNFTLADQAAVNLSPGATITGRLTTNGGEWTGLGTVNGPVTVASTLFSVNGGAVLTAPAGVTVTTGVLAGTGTVAAPLQIADGGIVSPSGESSPGTLRVTGNVAFQLNAILTAEIDTNSTNADQLAVTGDLALGDATLDLRDVGGATPPPGRKFTIATYTGTLTGTFAGQAEGSKLQVNGVNYTIKYADGGKNITLTAPGASGYGNWASNNNVLEGETGDDDKDGISNLVEYALGLNPKAVNPSPGSFNGTLLSFSKGTEASAAGDLTYVIEQSTTLTAGSWTPLTPLANNPTTISANLPTGIGGKVFARLKITK